METIEQLVEKEASYQKIGHDSFLELFKEVMENEMKRNNEYNRVKTNLTEIGKITRFCTNPYAALISIRDIYTISETRKVQGIINWLYVSYKSRTMEMEMNGKYLRNMKFTPQEIDGLISFAKKKFR